MHFITALVAAECARGPVCSMPNLFGKFEDECEERGGIFTCNGSVVDVGGGVMMMSMMIILVVAAGPLIGLSIPGFEDL